MKKLLLLLLCMPLIGLTQQTYVPDDNFEAYLESNSMGNGITNDDYVFTSNINTVTYLNVNSQNISDLTGIEDFIALSSLRFGWNQLTSVNLSSNTALTSLHCFNNQLISLDVSNNTSITILYCNHNQLTSLDVSSNTSLTGLRCYNNQIGSLDLSNNTSLNYLKAQANNLSSLDLRNGNNTNITTYNATQNPNLFCIDVDNPAYSTTNWVNIDPWAFFDANCQTVFGCTNPIACNYDSLAIIDDSSCIFQDNPITDMSTYTYTFEFQWGCSGVIYSSEI